MGSASNEIRLHSGVKYFQIFNYVPLFCIFARETSKVCILVELNNVGASAELLATIWLTLSIIFASFFGLKSDKECRRRLLLFTLAGSIFSLFVLLLALWTGSFWLYFTSIVFDGIFGSATIPIARAGYCEICEIKKTSFVSKDRLVTNTIIAQASSWVLLCLNAGIFEKFLVVLSTSSLITALLLAFFFFRDLRDDDVKRKDHEFLKIAKKLLKGYSLRLLIAFLVFDLAFQTLNYFSESKDNPEQLRQDFLIVEGLGIFIGCIITRFALSFIKNFRSSYLSILAFAIGLWLVYLTPWLRFIFSGNFVLDDLNAISFSSLGGVVLSLTFSYFAHKASAHQTGLIFGALEGIQILAEALIAFTFYKAATSFHGNESYVQSISLLALLSLALVFILKKEKKSKSNRHATI